jgi:hypothetical protein
MNNTEICDLGLNYFISKFDPFVINHIKNYYGVNWWEKGVLEVLRPEKAENLPEFKTELELISTIPFDVCMDLFLRHWKSIFSYAAGITQNHLVWIKEIRLFRNKLAHRGIYEIEKDEISRAFDTMQHFLKPIDSQADTKFKELKSVLSGAETVASTSSDVKLELLPPCPLVVDEWPIAILHKELEKSKNKLTIRFKKAQS